MPYGVLLIRYVSASKWRTQMRANRSKEALHTLNEAPPHQKRTLAFAIAYGWALIGSGNATRREKLSTRH